MTISTVSPLRVAELIKQGTAIDLIDVRTPAEYEEVHADGARLLPLDELKPADFHASGSGKPVFVICKSGGRAAKACAKLADAGVSDVSNVEGGTVAWESAGLPVVRGKKCMSLERQVRIGAGLMVLIGLLLGWLVHPIGFGLSAFVGCGLVFAGITDICGMAMILSRMPWNKRGRTSGLSCSS